MITIFNPDKVTATPFFKDLINFLWTHDDVTLRQIKSEFADVDNIDKLIETYVQKGYVVRENKRYFVGLDLMTSASQVSLDDMVFVDDTSASYKDLLAKSFETRLTNQTNALVLKEQTAFARDELTLANYFYKLAKHYPLSVSQQKLYAILGDVNKEYALKYMTTFLLKFMRKELVKQKRPDIFVKSLEILGYIEPVDEVTYRCLLDFDEENMTFTV